MLDKSLVVRFDVDDFVKIEKKSKERDISMSALVRHFVKQGLGDYDAKHEDRKSVV